jgi:hypothetical protein
MSSVIKHIYDPVHRQNFYYCGGTSLKRIKKLVTDTYGVDISDMIYDGAGKTFYVMHPEAGRGIFICIKNRGDLANLVHEIVHAVAFSLLPRGYDFDEKQEVFSYLSAFLFKECSD